jgi:hypothetical protein
MYLNSRLLPVFLLAQPDEIKLTEVPELLSIFPFGFTILRNPFFSFFSLAL